MKLVRVTHSFYQERPFVNNSTHKYLVYITAQGTIPGIYFWWQ
jgi:hypothetical protein